MLLCFLAVGREVFSIRRILYKVKHSVTFLDKETKCDVSRVVSVRLQDECFQHQTTKEVTLYVSVSDL